MRNPTPRSFLRAIIYFTASIAFAFSAVAQQNSEVDGVPLPANTIEASAGTSPFAGTWVGQWGDGWKTILVVESISDDGTAKAIYALGDNPRLRFKKQ